MSFYYPPKGEKKYFSLFITILQKGKNCKRGPRFSKTTGFSLITKVQETQGHGINQAQAELKKKMECEKNPKIFPVCFSYGIFHLL
jgi:hypothetical protein